MNNAGVGISLALLWEPVPKTLPPDPEGGWFSPMVWLALSDGRVVPGQCLHKSDYEQYDSPVHDWFIEKDGNSCSLGDEAQVIAWMPFAGPDHPSVTNGRMLIPNVEVQADGVGLIAPGTTCSTTLEET